jgi:hypothetical protein
MKKIFLGSFALLVIFSNHTQALITDEATFEDVDREDTHYNAIMELSGREITKGYEDKTYKPDQTITRSEFLKILIETKGDYSPESDPSGYDIYSLAGINFSDIQNKDWFIPYVRYALEKEIVRGYPDGTFQPSKTVNLAEALKMIYQTFEIPTVQFIQAPENWYEYYTAGLNADFEAKTGLNPQSDINKNITRGEMASMILFFEAKNS